MKKQRLLHLHSFLANNWRIMAKILQWDPELQQLYELSPSELSSLFSLPLQKSLQLFEHLHSASASSILGQLQECDAFFVTIWDEDYPPLLREIPDPPFVLYGKGNRKLLEHPQKIAVVGTRNPSSYGIKSIQSILANLLKSEWLVVSGLAYGIDTIAHMAALTQNRGTIAVLGGGFLYIYPQDNYKKLKNWHNNVLLLSEYPPSWKPQRWYFPKRNRIISGVSLGVIVAEAKEKSGSLITADCALEQNREVFAVPGPIYLDTSAGTNRLIQQGAKLITGAADIIEELK
jgi:DNA processing protein